MFQKQMQGVGRWWVVARFRSHLRQAGRQWAILGAFAAAWLLLIAVSILFSRGRDNGIRVLPVAGRVLLDGQPLNGGFVKFHPDAEKKNQAQFPPSAEIDANGNYVLLTGDKKGAPPGWYRVVIAAAETAENSKGKGAKDHKPPFNAKFTREDRTPLRVEVKENGDYTLKITK